MTSLFADPGGGRTVPEGIVMSGVADGIMSFENADSRPLISAMLQELGLEEGQVEQLEDLPYEALAAAYKRSRGYSGGGRLYRMRPHSQ